MGQPAERAAAAAKPRAATAVDSPERPSAGAPPAEIAFPTLVAGDMPVAMPIFDAVNWLLPRPMTDWPLVWDFDEPDKFPAWRKRIE